MRYQFIEDHRNDYPVTLLCRVMQVARSGYYAWRNEPLSLRKVADMVLLKHIRDIFEEGRQSYGSARIQGIIRAGDSEGQMQQYNNQQQFFHLDYLGLAARRVLTKKGILHSGLTSVTKH